MRSSTGSPCSSRCSRPGALFMLGDGHAAQGDGEIDGAAIETSFDVNSP